MVLYWVGPVPYLELLGGTSKKNTLYIKGGSRQILTSTLFRTVLFVSKRSYQKYKYASLKRYTPKFLGAPQKLTFVNGLASRSFRSQIPAYQNRQKLGVFFAQKQFSWPNGQLLCEKNYTVYSSFLRSKWTILHLANYFIHPAIVLVMTNIKYAWLPV